MNLKKFLHDHMPFLPHGSWKKAAEAIERKPQNFNEKSGWPHMVAKLEEAEKVLEAWGYELKIENKLDVFWDDEAKVKASSVHPKDAPKDVVSRYENPESVDSAQKRKKLIDVPYFEGL